MSFIIFFFFFQGGGVVFYLFCFLLLFFVAFLLLFNKSFKSVNDYMLNNDFWGKNCHLKRTSSFKINN